MEEGKACLTVLSCSKLFRNFSYLLNLVEAQDVKLHIEMKLADHWCVSSNISLKLATFIERMRVVVQIVAQLESESMLFLQSYIV